MMQELAMHILDIVHNSIRAEASSITVNVFCKKSEDICGFSVIDNGIGMRADVLDKVLDPFFTTRTTRKFGLGLPLLKMTCTMCDGEFSITSSPWQKTEVIAKMKRSHLDTPPWGDLAQTWMECFHGFPTGHLIFNFDFDNHKVVVDSDEIINTIGDRELCYDSAVLIQLRDYVADQITPYLREESYEIIERFTAHS